MIKCPNCERLKAELNGAREVVRSQGEFILSIKRLIRDYMGEDSHWRRIRDKSGSSN